MTVPFIALLAVASFCIVVSFSRKWDDVHVFLQKQDEEGVTSTDPEDKWFKAFSGALNDW